MAPLPTTATPRMVVDCRWRERPYDVLFRWSTATSEATAIAAVNAFFFAIADYMFSNWHFEGTGVWYPTGSHISTPVNGLDGQDGGGGSDQAIILDATQWQFLGRDTNGRRASWNLPGVDEAYVGKQRMPSSASPRVAGIYAALEDMRDAGMRTISGNAPLFKPYANIVINDYLTQQSRRG